VQLPPDLPHFIDAEVFRVDATDLRLQPSVTDRPGAGRRLLTA
jgi:hypothetical protein